MNRIKYIVQTSGLAVVLAGSLSARATIQLDLQEATLGQKASLGITATSTVGAAIGGNEWIGIYQFAGTGTDVPIGTFWSTCLSPAGVLDNNSHIYTSQPFTVGGGLGQNPAAWAAGTQGDAGIQNAQYLWRLYSPTIIASGTAAQGTGLALAMYYALYDSTSYGVVNTSSARFQLTSPVTGDIYNAYTGYLGGLNFAGVSANLAGGNILRSTEIGAGQDLIFNVAPVPEPTTMIAGALLLLPFGMSTLRFLRKNRTA